MSGRNRIHFQPPLSMIPCILSPSGDFHDMIKLDAFYDMELRLRASTRTTPIQADATCTLCRTATERASGVWGMDSGVDGRW